MSSNLSEPLLREGSQPPSSSSNGPGAKEPPIAVCVFNQPIDDGQRSAAEKRLEGAPATKQTIPGSTAPSASSSSSSKPSGQTDSTKDDASQSATGSSGSSSKRPPLPRLLSVGASDELIDSPQPADSKAHGQAGAKAADYARPNVAEDIDRIKREVVNAAHANESAAESVESGRTEQKMAALVEGAAHTEEPQLQEESVSELEKKGRAIVENMVKATIIKPLLVKLDGVHNFRDLSSYPTEIHAKAIRPGVLFRSGMLDLATIQDVDYLQQRLNTIIDLRDPREYAEDLRPQKHRLLRRLHEWRRKKGSPRARPHFFRHRSRRSPTSAAAPGFTPATEPIHETKTESSVAAPVPQAPADTQAPTQPAPPAAPSSPVTLLHVKFPVGIEEADPAVKSVSTAQSETAAPDSGVTMFMKHAPAAEPALPALPNAPPHHHDKQAKNLFQMPLANHHALKKLAWDSASLAEKGKFLFLRFGACRAKESEELMTRVVGRQGLLGYNRVMVLYCHEEVCRVLKLIAVKEHQPIVFHCTHGKDRTGLIAALVLHVLCVPREYIISDYASSAEYIPAKAYEEMLSRPGFTAEQWACCPPLIITKTFELIESTYGSVDAYLDVIGFDRRWRDTMREALLVDEAPDADLGSSDSDSSTDDSRPPSAAPTPGLEGSSATPAPNAGPRGAPAAPVAK